MKREFVKAEVKVIKFECEDILTGNSTNPDIQLFDELGAYISKKYDEGYQIYDSQFKLGPAKNNVTGYGLYYAGWGWMSVSEFKKRSDLMGKISNCM